VQKVRDVSTSPIPPRRAASSIATNFGRWGQVADLINHAKFYINGLMGRYLPEEKKYK